jgi:putative ABC transport system permease protein
MESLLQDLRYACRMLVRNPGFTTVAVLTLALGIGANTAIFSVVDAVLLEPLPFEQPDRLVVVNATNRRSPGSLLNTSYPDLTDWRAQTETFKEIAGVRVQSFDLTDDRAQEPVRVPGAYVTANYFDALRVRPHLGRFFRPEEDRLPVGAAVAVLSYGLWGRRFGSDPAWVGRTVYVNGVPHEVVGVAPQGFEGHSGGAQLWTPVTTVNTLLQRYNRIRPARWIPALGRLQPGVSLAQAQAEMDTIARRLATEYPNSNANFGVHLAPLAEQLVGNLPQIILAAFGAVGLVLLIACANVASLLLARGARREKEIAIRAALGASPTRLVRQLITETVLLSLLGGALGVLLAAWGMSLLPAFFSGLPTFVALQLDNSVLVFAVLLSIASGILFGMAPAFRLSAADLHERLKEGGRGPAAGGRQARFQGALVVAEVALAVILLVSAGLLFRTVDKLLSLELGFNPDKVATARFWLHEADYSPEEVEIFNRRLLASLKEKAGAKAVSAGVHIPLDGFRAGAVLNIEGEALDDPNSGFQVWHHPGSSDYFRVFGIPLLRGRAFTDEDTADSPGVIILSESAAQRFWSGEDPLGKRVKFRRDDQITPWLTVVGVVGDVRFVSLTGQRADSYDVYLPMPQSLFQNRFLGIAVRTAGDPAAFAPVLRQAIHDIDPGLPIFNAATLDSIVADATAQNRTTAGLLGAFSLVALGLAALGLYGVISYSVSRRTHEIGVRMALGAQRRDILRLVVGQGLRLTLAGLVVGLVAAVGSTRFLSSLLFGVSPTDPYTFAGISLLLAGVAALACYLPARRASGVDPMIALRYE